MLITGELLMLSTEQYSDQTHAGPFKILKDFDIHDVAKIVGALPVVKYPDWRTKNGPDDVIDYLKANQFIEEVPCYKIHLGSYGDINVTPEKENV